MSHCLFFRSFRTNIFCRCRARTTIEVSLNVKNVNHNRKDFSLFFSMVLKIVCFRENRVVVAYRTWISLLGSLSSLTDNSFARFFVAIIFVVDTKRLKILECEKHHSYQQTTSLPMCSKQIKIIQCTCRFSTQWSSFQLQKNGFVALKTRMQSNSR